jgi:hypothetical protein
MSVSMSVFKPGERIALPYLPVLRIENDVAILAKKRVAVGAECGARHRVRIEAPFFVRGGFRVKLSVKYEVPFRAFRVVFRTPYDSIVTEDVPMRTLYLDEQPDKELAERLVREEFGNKVAQIINIEVADPPKPVDVYVRKFRHAEVILRPNGEIIDIRKDYEGDTYFVYEFVNSDEAKLVDDVSRIDYVLLIFGHDQGSRAGCAEIRILGGDIVWSDVKHTCCRIASSAVAMLIAKYGSRIVIAKNNLPYRGCCEEWKIEEWESVIPPRRLTSYTSSEPVVTDLKPEEVA